MNTVVITGASKGLGRVIAEMLAQKGWQVIGTGRSERPAALQAAIEYHQFDAANANACNTFWQEIAEAYQDIHLINNAGGYLAGRVVDMPAVDFQNQMTSNYFASVYMTQGLIKNVPSAKIVNILSSGALNAHAGQSAYGASKAAAMHFFQTLQKEVSPQDYPITNIYPSDIATHGPNEKAIDPADLALLIVEQLERKNSLYITDMTIHPN